jgi:teichuronic acid biosynthesis glycosyltransferase TuaH
MSTLHSPPPVLMLAANTPWVYALGQALSEHTTVTTVRILDLPNYRRLKPVWPETVSKVRRVSVVLPQGYAGLLAGLLRPFTKALVVYHERRLRRQSGQDPLVIVPYPFAATWVRHVPGHRLVYYNLDEYPLYQPERTKRILQQESELVAHAGLTICLSLHQVETLAARNPASANKIRHFPLGVVEGFLNPNPHSSPLRNSVGYVGNLSDRVDWQFVVHVATLQPDVEFYFVGPLDRPDDCSGWRGSRSRAFALPNVHYEGEVDQAQVREHYWRYAINWMPYDVTHPFNIASCPTKIMDALASGKPFVSTDIPEVRQYSDRLVCVTSAKEAATVLSRFLLGQQNVDPVDQVKYASEQTWRHRAVEFLRLTADLT